MIEKRDGGMMWRRLSSRTPVWVCALLFVPLGGWVPFCSSSWAFKYRWTFKYRWARLAMLAFQVHDRLAIATCFPFLRSGPSCHGGRALDRKVQASGKHSCLELQSRHLGTSVPTNRRDQILSLGRTCLGTLTRSFVVSQWKPFGRKSSFRCHC